VEVHQGGDRREEAAEEAGKETIVRTFVLLALVGCGPVGATFDAGHDSGSADPDSGSSDAGTVVDAGAYDAGQPHQDAGIADSGADPDAGGGTDGGTLDAGGCGNQDEPPCATGCANGLTYDSQTGLCSACGYELGPCCAGRACGGVRQCLATYPQANDRYPGQYACLTWDGSNGNLCGLPDAGSTSNYGEQGEPAFGFNTPGGYVYGCCGVLYFESTGFGDVCWPYP
jgi:hypothetical protein